MTTPDEGYKPQEHFRNLKGQMYLEVKHRVTWFRDEHADGYIKTELVEHDAAAGLAVFKAEAGWVSTVEKGTDAEPVRSFLTVYATGYGSETKGDFTDYVEKAETKAVGRALAFLGYGTAQAMDLDEGGSVADSPVERRPRTAQQQPARAQTQPTRRPAPVIHEPASQQQRPPQTNDEAEAAALETQQRRLHEMTQSDKEGKTLLQAWLQRNGMTRISEMGMADVTEWLLIFHDRSTSPDPAPVAGI
jgi:hypothetical protein